ncbi:MAG TPA: patatin-like phospholipase family protein [Gaiellaceae bacterium]|nr:patatin-like phospholipase family protein [Gaiellaceae bacterium]
MSGERDVALVMSGGGMNGMLLELGFLKRLRASPLWPRVGWVYGTSAGALAGVMAALDQLDELESFLLQLEPDETFRPHRLWQTPLTGLHDYRLPETIEERLGPIAAVADELARSPVELVVCVTDVADAWEEAGEQAFERTFSSHRDSPDVMGRAVLASAAISALVLPLRVGDVIGTDGGWVRNFPLGHAYDNPEVERIVGFRYFSHHPRPSSENLSRLRRRLERFRAVPPVRALIGELVEAEQRQARGEPAHLADMIVRLMRIAIARNTELEQRHASDKDASVQELETLRRDVERIARRHALPGRRARVAAEIEARFAAARFPFRHDRALPTVIVRGDPGEAALDPSFRAGLVWPLESKQALIDRGYALTDEELARHGIGLREAV